MIQGLPSQLLTSFISFWWIILPVLIFLVFREFWIIDVIDKHIRKIEWTMLEISMPKHNIKSIGAMEQVFVSLHGIYSNGIKLKKRWLSGVVEDWISLEMVGHAHSIHFYVRIPKKYENLARAAFFAQYPNIEIKKVEDYIKELPHNLPNNYYDIFGGDFILAKDDAYPIRTYPELEVSVKREKEEDKAMDPMATIAEVMSNLKKDELIWIQLLIRPIGDELIEKAKTTIDELTGKKSKKKTGALGITGEFIGNLVAAPVRVPTWSGVEGDAKSESSSPRSPGDQEIIKAVQKKMSKVAFDGILRFIYIDKRDEFTEDNVTAVTGAFMQYSSPMLNSLKLNKSSATIKINGAKKYSKAVLERNRRVYRNYLNRAMPQGINQPFQLKLKTSMFNVEELATLFHPPSIGVKAPKIQLIESKTGSPPVDLPIKDSN